jgi:signal transduction histidine kinase
MLEYSNAGSMSTEGVENQLELSGNPEAFFLQPNAINYAVESSYYLYGRILQEAKESAVAFDVLDAYGWINDFYTVNQESWYYAHYEGEKGNYTDTNITEESGLSGYNSLVDSEILNSAIDALAENHNIMGALLLEFDEYGRISKVEFVGAGDITCDQNLYAKARESVLQYEQNATIYQNMHGDKAELDMKEVLPKDFKAVFLLPADSRFWNQFSINLDYYVHYFNNAENMYVEIGAPVLVFLGMLFVALVALLLPFIKKLNTGWEKLFCMPFEIISCLVVAGVGLAYMMFEAMCHTSAVEFAGADVEILGYVFDSGELYGWALAGNVLGWALVFFMEYTVVAHCRQFLCGPLYYVKNRILIVRLVRWLGGIIKRGYHALVDIKVTKGLHRVVIKMVLINFVIVSLLCCGWFAGIAGVAIYSVILYFIFCKNGQKLQGHYDNLLDATRRMAEGELKIELKEDLGYLTPLGEELGKVQEGFSKAVAEEAKSQKMKTELISNVSHDLKTPLTAIITYVNLLKQDDIPEETRKNYVNTLDMKSQRLKVLIEDLFEVSKAQSGNIQMNYMDVDVVNLMKQLRLEMEDKIADSDLVFRWNLPEEKVVLSLDGQRTYRVFENLLTNALKYALSGSRVFVDVINNEDAVEIIFKNTSAMEMPMDASQLTERFVRGEASRTSEGSGLGLAIVKNFVELQGGTFKIEIDGDLFKAIIVWKKERNKLNISSVMSGSETVAK